MSGPPPPDPIPGTLCSICLQVPLEQKFKKKKKVMRKAAER